VGGLSLKPGGAGVVGFRLGDLRVEQEGHRLVSQARGAPQHLRLLPDELQPVIQILGVALGGITPKQKVAMAA